MRRHNWQEAHPSGEGGSFQLKFAPRARMGTASSASPKWTLSRRMGNTTGSWRAASRRRIRAARAELRRRSRTGLYPRKRRTLRWAVGPPSRRPPRRGGGRRRSAPADRTPADGREPRRSARDPESWQSAAECWPLSSLCGGRGGVAAARRGVSICRLQVGDSVNYFSGF